MTERPRYAATCAVLAIDDGTYAVQLTIHGISRPDNAQRMAKFLEETLNKAVNDIGGRVIETWSGPEGHA